MRERRIRYHFCSSSLKLGEATADIASNFARMVLGKGQEIGQKVLGGIVRKLRRCGLRHRCAAILEHCAYKLIETFLAMGNAVNQHTCRGCPNVRIAIS